ncbi:GNAT family N-acetyltransferase [Streptomyces sp. BA2]|uniref:GNAT family N-acetyltransferase n=1 Tax=Streptomyces sp. BA2 TaxID=436595 RepID=UPI001F428931|nr:GNAT family protein [Streptomyces sp. BA2]
MAEEVVAFRTSYYWTIGIRLLPEARGRGVGARAQRLLVRYLFAHTPVTRIEADTEAENTAERRALAGRSGHRLNSPLSGLN